MSCTRCLTDASNVKKLAVRLSSLRSVSRFDHAEHKEGWTLALTFAGVENVCQKLSDELLPRLLQKGVRDPEVEETLTQIGDQFHFLLQHIRDPKFYGYLFDEDESGGDSESGGLGWPTDRGDL